VLGTRGLPDVGLADRSPAPDTAATRFLDWLGRIDRRWIIVSTM
jgi:hypothetical protein